MEFSEILNFILGGGLLASLVGIVTLRATVRKANAEAEKAKADAEKAKAEAETVRIDNAERATRILIENIVEPLKKELSETREELRSTKEEFGETKREFGATKREMARLRKAVESANSCRFSVDCPVLFKLRDLPKSNTKGAGGGDGSQRQPRARSSPGTDGNGTDVGGEDGDTDGQPP
jgi:hypothetical protein B2_07717